MNTKDEIREVLERVFVCMPVSRLDERFLRLIRDYRLNLEIGLDHVSLESRPESYFKKLARELGDSVAAFTVHAPFNELFLGAPDRAGAEGGRHAYGPGVQGRGAFSPPVDRAPPELRRQALWLHIRPVVRTPLFII